MTTSSLLLFERTNDEERNFSRDQQEGEDEINKMLLFCEFLFVVVDEEEENGEELDEVDETKPTEAEVVVVLDDDDEIFVIHPLKS